MRSRTPKCRCLPHYAGCVTRGSHENLTQELLVFPGSWRAKGTTIGLPSPPSRERDKVSVCSRSRRNCSRRASWAREVVRRALCHLPFAHQACADALILRRLARCFITRLRSDDGIIKWGSRETALGEKRRKEGGRREVEEMKKRSDTERKRNRGKWDQRIVRG